MSEKNYIGGSAKAVQTQYGEILNVSLKLADMQAIANEKGYVNMSILKRQSESKYGDTHYVLENSYKKEEQGKQATQSDVADMKPSTDTGITVDDIPF